jgi:hypothetical protein
MRWVGGTRKGEEEGFDPADESTELRASLAAAGIVHIAASLGA